MSSIEKCCPDRLDEDGIGEEAIIKAIKEIAEIAELNGFCRFKDYVYFLNEEDDLSFENEDKFAANYGLKAAIISTKKQARKELLEYIEEMRVEAMGGSKDAL